MLTVGQILHPSAPRGSMKELASDSFPVDLHGPFLVEFDGEGRIQTTDLLLIIQSGHHKESPEAL